MQYNGVTVAELLNEHPPSVDRFSLYVVSADSPYAALAHQVEREVLGRYFAASATDLDAQYGPYAAQSLYLVAVDQRDKQVAGSIRVIEHGAAGLKTLNDIAEPPLGLPTELVLRAHGLDLRTTWDVAALAVSAAYRDRQWHRVSLLLYGLLRREAAARGIQACVAVLDDHVFRQLVGAFAVPFEPILDSDPFAYLGTPKSLAVVGHLAEMPAAMAGHWEHVDACIRDCVRAAEDVILRGAGLPPSIYV